MEPTPNSELGMHSDRVHTDHGTNLPVLGTSPPEEGTSFVTVDEYHVSDHAASVPQHGVYDARGVRDEALIADNESTAISLDNERQDARRNSSRRDDALMEDNARTALSLDNDRHNARRVM